jgi:hypothetical protein
LSRLLARTAWALALVAWAPAARAQTYQNSPHVDGNDASVRVYYDQRVNNTQVKKDVFIYKGPKTEQVLAAVRTILAEREAELAQLVNKDDVKALREDVLAQLEKHFNDQPDLLTVIKQQLSRPPLKHKGYWDVNVGITAVATGGPGLGGSGQLGGHLDVLTLGAFRHSLGLALGFEVLDREERSRIPAGEELDPDSRLAFHGWAAPGYEVWWLSQHLSLQLSLLIGAQAFEAGSGSSGPRVTYGGAIGPVLHIGDAQGSGANIGISWRIESMTRPVFQFEGFGRSATPERTLQHVVM